MNLLRSTVQCRVCISVSPGSADIFLVCLCLALNSVPFLAVSPSYPEAVLLAPTCVHLFSAGAHGTPCLRAAPQQGISELAVVLKVIAGHGRSTHLAGLSFSRKSMWVRCYSHA